MTKLPAPSMAPLAIASPATPLRVAMLGDGSTVHAVLRATAIARLGHEVRLVTVDPVLPHPDLEVKSRPRPRGVFENAGAWSSMLRDLREFKPDVLHLHYAGGALGALALASGIAPLVVTVMGGDVQPEQLLGRANSLDSRITRRILKQADVILSKSVALRRHIARYGDFDSKIETVRWGIRLSDFARDRGRAEAWRAARMIPPGRLILSPRLLRPLYNIHLIVEALPGILRKHPDTVLGITTHGEEAEYGSRVRRRVSELGLEGRVVLLDPISYGEMPAALAASDLVVSIPFSDGLPQTLFECLASETPIVLGRLPAYDELVHPDREAVLTAFEPEAIAAAACRILGSGPFARRLTRAGLERVRQEPSLEDEASRVAALYREAMSRRRPSAARASRVLDLLSIPFMGAEAENRRA